MSATDSEPDPSPVIDARPVRDAKPTITAYPDGPLLVRGDVELQTTDGETIPRRRGTIALCRCGLSSIKPFCDGTHRAAGFRTED